jgi:hypothetical protein
MTALKKIDGGLVKQFKKSLRDVKAGRIKKAEPQLRPEYLEKLKKIRKGKFIKYKSIEDLRKATS